MSLLQDLARARKRYLKRRTDANLRAYLKLKARLGIFDKRMCSYFGVNPRVNSQCKKAICRAYAAGLVPTSTTGGKHAPNSLHYEGRAVDFGLRNPNDIKQRAALKAFHRKEFWRAVQGKISPVELIGPYNQMTILRSSRTKLAEGTALEQAHDNHLHIAF